MEVSVFTLTYSLFSGNQIYCRTGPQPTYSSCSGVDSNSDLFSCSGVTELTVNTETVCPLSTSDLFSQLANLHEVLDGSDQTSTTWNGNPGGKCKIRVTVYAADRLPPNFFLI